MKMLMLFMCFYSDTHGSLKNVLFFSLACFSSKVSSVHFLRCRAHYVQGGEYAFGMKSERSLHFRSAIEGTFAFSHAVLVLACWYFPRGFPGSSPSTIRCFAIRYDPIRSDMYCSFWSFDFDFPTFVHLTLSPQFWSMICYAIVSFS